MKMSRLGYFSEFILFPPLVLIATALAYRHTTPVQPMLWVFVYAAGIAGWTLLEYVLPQFTPIFEQAGAQLPASTRALMVLGTAVGAAGPWFLAGTLAAALVARQLLARPANRLKLDPEVKCYLPGVPRRKGGDRSHPPRFCL